MAISVAFCLRVLIWAGCLVGFLYQTSSMLSLFFEYPFSVTLVEDVRKNILFPAATVCIHRWINFSKICEQYVSHCDSAGKEALTNPEIWSFMRTDGTLRAPVAHLPHELFKCHMRSKVTECASFGCDAAIRLTYYRYPNEMCYTIDAYQWTNSQHPIQQCDSPWNYELVLRASWDRNATIALAEPEALPLVVHSPYTCPPDKLSSVMIQPGMTYTIAVSQEKVRRLPAPYKSSCTDYISMGNQKKYFGYYTQDICAQNCEMTLDMKYCQCVRTRHEFSAMFGGQICDVIRDDICARKVESLQTNQLCLSRCRMACEETKYDVRLSSLAVDKSKHGQGKRERISSQPIHQIYEEKESAGKAEFSSSLSPEIKKTVEAFGYFGGYVGIWLGFSLLSLLLNVEARVANAVAKRAQRGKADDKAVHVFRLKQRF